MIDLHIHTTYSDGKFTVKEILQMAENKKIHTISFCDHNVLGAYEELKNRQLRECFSGRIITGIEFDFVYQQKDFHMLGYDFDVERLKHSKYIERRSEQELIEMQEDRLAFLKSVCKKLNIKLTPGLKIQTLGEQANDIIKADMQKHKENDEILDTILGKDRKNSFWLGHVTNPQSPFYIDVTENLPTAQEVADDIHQAGGIVVLPHVFEYKSVNNVEFLNQMYQLGILDGVECVHTKHNREQVAYLEGFCKEKGLFMSGGSDFHDDQKQTLGYTPLGEIQDKYFWGERKKSWEDEER